MEAKEATNRNNKSVKDSGDLHQMIALVSPSHAALTQLLDMFTLKISERNSDSKEFFIQHVPGTETLHKDELQHQELWKDLRE